MKLFVKILNFIQFILFIQLIQGQKRVAIIGGGIGGAATAHYLKQIYGKHVDITLFENTEQLGGRTRHVEIQQIPREQGASFFIKENLYIQELIKEAKLKSRKLSQEDPSIGIWNGEGLTFLQQKGYFFRKYLDQFKSFGFSPLRLKYFIASKLEDWMRVYDYTYLGYEHPFHKPEELLEKLNLRQYLNQTIEEFLKDADYNEDFSNQFLQGVIASLYNQNNTMNMFAGLISFAGMFGDAYKVENGNGRIVQQLFEKKKYFQEMDVKTNTEVLKIEPHETRRFQIRGQGKIKFGVSVMRSEFDVIIIACPLNSIKNFNSLFALPNFKIPSINYKYKKSVVNYLSAVKIKNEYFGIQDQNDLPDILLSSNKSNTLISEYITICRKCYDHGRKNMYKIQSDKQLTQQEIDLFLEDGAFLNKYEWEFAYPELRKVKEEESLSSFIISEGIYYLNAMEEAASCMELQLIAAHNVVNLILHEDKEFKNLPTNSKVLGNKNIFIQDL